MTKYHIKADGTPGVCHAEKGKCPLGGANEHYSTQEGAQKAADSKMVEQYGINHVAHQEELLKQKAELTKQLETTKGLKRILLFKKIVKVDYALQGRDYDAEKKQEKEEQQKRLKAFDEENKQSDINAKKISEMKSLELPKKIEMYLVTRKYTPNPDKTYRGELNLHAKTNSGTALYGQGRYTTTNRKYAKSFGTVRHADMDELPTNPLRIHDNNGFQLFEQEVAREHKIKLQDLYKYMNPDDMIKKMGYDGLTVGTSNDMTIVKYY